MSSPPPPPPSSIVDSTKHDALVNGAAPAEAPWLEFIDIHSLSFPTSFLDVQARLNKNITHFQKNYLSIFISIFYLFLIVIDIFSLGRIPNLSLFFYVYTPIVCAAIYDKARSPLQLQVFGFSFVVEQRCLFLGLLLVLAVLAFALHEAWALLMGFFVISSSIIGLHCVLFRPSSINYEQEPQQGLWIIDNSLDENLK